MPQCSSQYDRERLTDWAEWLRAKTSTCHLFLFNHLLGLIPANELGIPVCLTALGLTIFAAYDLMYEGRERCSLDKRGEFANDALVSYSRGNVLFPRPPHYAADSGAGFREEFQLVGALRRPWPAKPDNTNQQQRMVLIAK